VDVICHCGAPQVCSVCESCAEHCNVRDPVACAASVYIYSAQGYGRDDERTVTARRQLLQALSRTG
jgi:hypothetical protein